MAAEMKPRRHRRSFKACVTTVEVKRGTSDAARLFLFCRIIALHSDQPSKGLTFSAHDLGLRPSIDSWPLIGCGQRWRLENVIALVCRSVCSFHSDLSDVKHAEGEDVSFLRGAFQNCAACVGDIAFHLSS